MPKPTVDPQNVVDASPTKEFFIDILVRDVELTYAIAELVDNSVDGAKLLRETNGNKGSKKETSLFHGLYVHISFDTNRFEIVDNCGGMSVDTAKRYAFKFGRIDRPEKIRRGVGTFGVGMKRALFKLGGNFEIESTTKNSSFSLELDVEQWKKKKENDSEDWHFPLSRVSENDRNAANQIGTTIEVTQLHNPVKEEFSLKSFKNRLVVLIQDQQSINVAQGLEIKINDHYLDPVDYRILLSKRLKPFLREKSHQVTVGKRKGRVKVRIIAGVGRASKLSQAGWYIYCNGRMVLRADKSSVTGWGVKGAEKGLSAQFSIPKGQGTPSAHNQFAHFRGFVFFESDDTTLLPWNTAKSGIDPEAPVYQTVKLEMIAALREVIDFLNRLDAEKDRREYALQEVMDDADEVDIVSLKSKSAHFTAPETGSTDTDDRMVKILYHKPAEEFELVKRLSKARSAKQVGEVTFEYYLNSEGQS